MVIHRVEKTVNEIKTKTLDFTNALASGVTISSATVTATIKSTGGDGAAVIVDTTPTVTSPLIPIGFTGGTDGEAYLVVVKATLSNSDVIEVYIELRVLVPS